MNKTAIIYKSKYNTTKKYAGWLAIKLDADLYEISDIRSYDLKNYENIIFGGWIENGRIKGISFIKDNYSKIKDKNVIVFFVGIGIYKKEEIINKNFFPKNYFEKIKYVYLPGDFDFNNLSVIDKIKIAYGNGKINSSLINYEKPVLKAKKNEIYKILKLLSK